MIIEVPSPSDFGAAGINSLNLAWSIVTGLSRELQDAQVEEWDAVGEVADEYWRRSQSPLGNALTLAQQGIELMLKARIAEVSPFLLLSREIRDWPSSDKRAISFAEFRTVDAADLIKLHNSVCTDQLEDDFIQLFELVRKRRNQIIHQGKDKKSIHVGEMLEAILKSVHRLFPAVRWMKQRSDYLHDDHVSAAYSVDHVLDQLCNEAEIIIRHLGAASLKEFFGFDKKARKYFCPECACYAKVDRYALAHLRPNEPNGTTLYCLVCDDEHEVQRKKCKQPRCPSNVISMDGTCLTCWGDQ
jgi:hypothetical protein